MFKYSQKIAVLTIFLYASGIITPGICQSQTLNCNFDLQAPTYENALASFRSKDYKCAELELLQLQELNTVDYKTLADSYVLLAQVYFTTLQEDQKKRSHVRRQLTMAYRINPDWQGNLEIYSAEFNRLMKDAKSIADRQGPLELDRTTSESDSLKTVSKEKKKPWYRSWWAYGTGVGLMVSAIVLLGGGGTDAEQPTPPADTIDAFPPPP